MPESIKRVHVVAGIIRDAESRILISRRAEHLHQGGLWEFPGGKVESGEEVYDALARELKEELGIKVEQAAFFQTISHDYPDKKVLLEFWEVSNFSGLAVGKEGQECRWIDRSELEKYPFPDANKVVVSKLLAG